MEQHCTNNKVNVFIIKSTCGEKKKVQSRSINPDILILSTFWRDVPPLQTKTRELNFDLRFGLIPKTVM